MKFLLTEILQPLDTSIALTMVGLDFKQFFSFVFWNAMERHQLVFIELLYSTSQDY